jgi:putative heme-binding domain-containing protein
MGPDLTEIGTKRGPENLRQSLLDPEAEVADTFAVYRRVIFIPDNFLQIRVTMRDGHRITGVRVNEDAFTIQIRDGSDRIYSFRKEELFELHKDWGRSPMPSYRGVLGDGEIQDVVAYLMSLQEAP